MLYVSCAMTWQVLIATLSVLGVVVSSSSSPSMLRQYFDLLDTNGDERITLDELQSFGYSVSSAPGHVLLNDYETD